MKLKKDDFDVLFDPEVLTDKNVRGHKKLNVGKLEEIAGCFRVMSLFVDDIKHLLNDHEKCVSQIKNCAEMYPEQLPSLLQAFEWKLGEIVDFAGQLVQNAGEAAKHCHSVRGGNETLLQLIMAIQCRDKKA